MKNNSRVPVFLVAALAVVSNPVAVVLALSTNPSSRSNKVQGAALKRFKSFNTLCKTCPTLLQPKIDTIAEMIMGLPSMEREELLLNVARRIKEEEASPPLLAAARIQSARDVFQFQTGVDSAGLDQRLVKDDSPRKERKERAIKSNKGSPTSADSQSIFRGKMTKARGKLQETKVKFARVKRLLDQTNSILAGDTEALVPVTDVTDPAVYHRIDKLQRMSRPELKMQRLKYVAQKLKYDQKLAKGRVKIYGASLALAKEQEKASVV